MLQLPAPLEPCRCHCLHAPRRFVLPRAHPRSVINRAPECMGSTLGRRQRATLDFDLPAHDWDEHENTKRFEIIQPSSAAATAHTRAPQTSIDHVALVPRSERD